jgi:hypothetical protein
MVKMLDGRRTLRLTVDGLLKVHAILVCRQAKRPSTVYRFNHHFLLELSENQTIIKTR